MKKQTKQTGIVGLIDTRQTYHCTQSIDRWKQAINAFESLINPTRVLLYDMYDDILLDGQLESVWGKRQDNILNRRLTFMRDGVEDEAVTNLLGSADMRNLLRELHNTIAYGYTLIQINNIWFDAEQESYRIDFDLIPRKHVHPEPGFECISKEQYAADPDFLYKRPPLSNYMIWAGEPKDKGLFVKVAPYVIYKRGTLGDWAQFSEMFGMPFREAIYDAYDDDTRQKIEALMKHWSAANYFVHQRDVELKIHTPGSAAQSSDIYDHLMQACDAGISKTILGNTLTTEQGENGARSLGEVHEGEENSKKQSDDRFILSILNTQLRAILKRFGIDVAGGEIWFESAIKDWKALKEKWDVISAVSNKIPVDDDYIYEEFDIPKPDNYDQLKKDREQTPATPGGTPQNVQPDSRSASPVGFWRRLHSFFALGRTAERPSLTT
jgi:hypothetical protein